MQHKARQHALAAPVWPQRHTGLLFNLKANRPMMRLLFILTFLIATFSLSYGQEGDAPAPQQLFDDGLDLQDLGLQQGLGVQQEGDNNRIQVEQQLPESQSVQLQQIGDYNNIAFDNEGAANELMIRQQGLYNQADLGEFGGSSNRMLISQQGNQNVYTREGMAGAVPAVDGVQMVVEQQGDGNRLQQVEDGLTPATQNPFIVRQNGGANVEIQFSSFLPGGN